MKNKMWPRAQKTESSEQEKHSGRWRKSWQAVQKIQFPGTLRMPRLSTPRGGGLSHSAKVSKERGPEKAGGHGVTQVTDSWFI